VHYKCPLAQASGASVEWAWQIISQIQTHGRPCFGIHTCLSQLNSCPGNREITYETAIWHANSHTIAMKDTDHPVRGGGDHQQNGGRRANNADFTFSVPHQAQFPPAGPANGERGGRRQYGRGRGGWRRRGDDTRHSPHVASRGNHTVRGGGGFRKAPHERPLLQIRDDTVVQTYGIAGPNKFHNTDDMSDDDEVAMDTDSDKSVDDSAVRGKRKLPRKQANIFADGNCVPKWSNPDPYTALPPPDETTGKRLDVVKLIRKSKNEAAEKVDASNAVAANDDFISFGGDTNEADQLVALDDEVPLAPWHHSSSNRQPLAGSLNEVATAEALTAVSSAAKLTAATASLPEKPQKRSQDLKRQRDDGVDIVQGWQSVPDQSRTPWTTFSSYAHLEDPLQR
jgi:non-canonical poly(A) RNA polymerase PAPD5/7